MNNRPKTLKVVLLGDRGIGKTWLLETLGEKEHLDWQAHDAGTPSLMGHLETQWQWRGAEWNVQLCNPAGGSSIGGSGGFVPSARLPAANPCYLTMYQETDIALYAGTDILLLGFDLTCNKSLARLRHWHYSFCACAAPKAVVVVGTKADLYRERSESILFESSDLVDYDDAHTVAAQLGAHALVFTSAKTAQGTVEDHSVYHCPVPDDFGYGEQWLDQTLLRLAEKIEVGAHIPPLLDVLWLPWLSSVRVELLKGLIDLQSPLSQLNKNYHILQYIWHLILAEPQKVVLMLRSPDCIDGSQSVSECDANNDETGEPPEQNPVSRQCARDGACSDCVIT